MYTTKIPVTNNKKNFGSHTQLICFDEHLNNNL